MAPLSATLLPVQGPLHMQEGSTVGVLGARVVECFVDMVDPLLGDRLHTLM